jgi:hypothetical protein
MARKVNIDSSDTLSTFQTKVNLKADYVGDLDHFNIQLKFGQAGGAPFYSPLGLHDSALGGFAHQHSPKSMSLVSALNMIESGYDYVHNLFTDSTGILNVHFLDVDSAVFNKVSTGNLITDSDFLILDSATFTISSGLALQFDSGYIDSARINYVSGSYLNYPGTAENFNILRFDSGLTADSGFFTNLSGTTFNYDSARIPTLSVDSVHLPNNTNMDVLLLESSTFNQLNFDNIQITDMKKLVLTDRSPLDTSTFAAVGSIVLAGHLVSTNNDSAIV